MIKQSTKWTPVPRKYLTKEKPSKTVFFTIKIELNEAFFPTKGYIFKQNVFL